MLTLQKVLTLLQSLLANSLCDLLCKPSLQSALQFCDCKSLLADVKLSSQKPSLQILFAICFAILAL